LVGSRVRVIRKPGKFGEFKHDFNNWSEVIYTVSTINYDNGQKFYTLQGHDHEYLRHELLKIEDAQKPAEGVAAGKRGTFKQEGLREKLLPYVTVLKHALDVAPGKKMYTSEAVKVMKYDHGFAPLLKEFPNFVTLLRMFSEFEVITPPGGGTSSVKLVVKPAIAQHAAGSINLLSLLPA